MLQPQQKIPGKKRHHLLTLSLQIDRIAIGSKFSIHYVLNSWQFESQASLWAVFNEAGVRRIEKIIRMTIQGESYSMPDRFLYVMTADRANNLGYLVCSWQKYHINDIRRSQICSLIDPLAYNTINITSIDFKNIHGVP